MVYRGGTHGFEHCEWKMLYRADGWRDAQDRFLPEAKRDLTARLRRI